MINYVRKFEGHKHGPEKDSKMIRPFFRYRISFLIAVNTFQGILFFEFVFLMSFSKVKNPKGPNL